MRDACIESVTVNGRPFKLMNDSWFRMIVDKVLNGLGFSSRLNQENIRKHVSDAAWKIMMFFEPNWNTGWCRWKSTLSLVLVEPLLALICSLLEMAEFIYAHSQWLKIDKRHTGEHFRTMVLDTLRLYGLKLEGVYSITTDGGSNLLKCVKL